MSMQVDLIDDWTGVRGLAAEWDALLARSCADTIFMRWDWLSCWMDIVGEFTAPHVITVRTADGELIGAAPFYVQEYRLLRTIRYRVLRIMGDFPTGGEYPAWVAAAGQEDPVMDAIARFLHKYASAWDCVWMPNMAGWARPIEDVTRASRGVGFFLRQREIEFGFTSLPASGDEFLAKLSANMRSTLRRQMKKILGKSGVVVERCTDAGSVPQFLTALFELHFRRWSTRGETGSFRRKPNEQRFYQCFAQKAFDRGWLRFYALRDGGEIRATQIGYVYGKVFHLLQEGFDPQYADGVGNVLRYKVIEDCIHQGVGAYDFLGELSEHKRRWTATSRKGANVFVGKRSMKNALLFLPGIWPTGKYLRPTQPLGTVAGRLAGTSGVADARPDGQSEHGENRERPGGVACEQHL